eukprot:298988_1
MTDTSAILPPDAGDIASKFLDEFQVEEDVDDTTIFLSSTNKKSQKKDDKKSEENKTKDESDPEEELDIGELYHSDSEENEQNQQKAEHLNADNKSGKLPNNDTQITVTTSTDEDSGNNHLKESPLVDKENINNINNINKLNINNAAKLNIEENKINNDGMMEPSNKMNSVLKKDELIIEEDTKENGADTKSSNTRKKADVGSRTMEQWLNRDNLIVHPVWIGNLPRGTTVN